MLAKIVGMAIVAIVAVTVLSLILSLPVLWLWNGCLVGAVDGVREVTWLQAFGINVLCGFLFRTTINKD